MAGGAHRASSSPLPGRRAVLAAAAATLAAAPLPRGGGGARADRAAPLTVFAAASLQDALRTLDTAWHAPPEGAGNPPLRLAFAASSALARQIEQGATAELFLSADEAWMDWLAARNLILPETRRDALGNTLVLIAPADAPAPGEPVNLAPGGTDLAARLGPRGRLAVGDPAHVPAGRYARAALTWLGQWPALAPRLARADNVRAALLLVERGEAPLGIVYGTDARAAGDTVRVLATFPSASHPPVTYPFALTRHAAGRPEAAALLGFLTGPEAAPVWRRFGFRPVGDGAAVAPRQPAP